MSKEIELRRNVSDTRQKIVRWAKAPQIVTPDLRRKEHLTRMEKLWVYSSLYIFVISTVITTLAIIWLCSPVTNKDSALVLLSVASPVAFFAGVRALWISENEKGNDPVGSITHYNEYTRRTKHAPIKRHQLNFAGRKQLCLYDRNRKRMPWYKDRLRRYADADGQYRQLSVWLEAKTRDGTKTTKGVQFYVFEHSRRRFGPWDIRVFANNGTLASDFLVDPSVESIIDKQHQLESFARECEEQGYEHAVGDHSLRRDVLRLRR